MYKLFSVTRPSTISCLCLLHLSSGISQAGKNSPLLRHGIQPGLLQVVLKMAALALLGAAEGPYLSAQRALQRRKKFLLDFL